MKKKFNHIKCLFVVLLLAVYFLLNSFKLGDALAQESGEPIASPAPVDAVEEPVRDVEKLKSLQSILESLSNIESEILKAQKALRGAEGQGREQELKGLIEGLSRQRESLRDNFKIIASESEMESLSGQAASSEIDWAQELKDLLGPLIREVKRLTSRPREIERLRSATAFFQEQLIQIDKALEKVRMLREQTEEKKLQGELENLENEWKEHELNARTELSIRNQKLQQLLGEKTTISASVKEIFDLFFRSRGRNLGLAVLATLLFFFGIRRGAAWLQKVSPFKREEKTYYLRVFNVLFLFLSGFGSLLVFLIVLFLFGDWVLLTLALMFVLGIAWSSKQAIPRFWAQALLLMNMGPVREGERLTYQGVPWRVMRLNFYTLLRNPKLDHGTLRLPIQDLTGLRSRQAGSSEPWFPTNTGDWVVLSDGTHGRVVTQTPEVVSVVLLGGSRKFYATADFIALNANVLAAGYRHTVSFGIDYGHQAEATKKIPDILKEFVQEKLLEHGLDESEFSLKVEFQGAGASSLNIAVISDFRGTLGEKYQTLERLLNRLCVDACNVNGWTIPFDQLTLHVPESIKVGSTSS
jgi:hypothetical protein